MKASELRIGNYVFNKAHERKQLKEIYSDCSVYDPIQLTEEWLLKFGFEKVADKIADHFNVGFCHYENKDCWIYLIGEGFELELITLDERANLARTYKYVHQLQNLYFALTGTELEITK